MATSDRSRQRRRKRRRTTSLVIAVGGLLVAAAWLVSAIMESGQGHSPNSPGGTLVFPSERGLDPWMPALVWITIGIAVFVVGMVVAHRNRVP